MEMLSGANSADAVRPVDAGVRAVPQCVAVSMLLPGTLVTVCTRYSRWVWNAHGSRSGLNID